MRTKIRVGLLALGLSGCSAGISGIPNEKDEGPTQPAIVPPRDETPPTVDAGPARFANAPIVLTATAFDTSDMTYAWSQVSGPGRVDFTTPAALSTTVKADAEGVYAIQFSARDAAGNTRSATVSLVWDTTAPLIDAGADVKASAAFNPKPSVTDASSVIYRWSMVDGPGRIVFDKDSDASPLVVASADGLYTLGLTVTDAAGNTAFDTLALGWGTAASAPADTAPPVIAPIQELVAGSPVAVAPTVTDASPVTYAWTTVSGPGTVSFSAASSKDTSLTASQDGAYVVRLTATDASGNASSIDVALRWDATAPVVDAGPDVAASAETSLAAQATDVSSMTYQWSQTSGPGTVTFGDATAKATTVSASVVGTYTLRFTATDAFARMASDTLILTWQDLDAGLFDWVGMKKVGPVGGTWIYRNGGSGSESDRDGGLGKHDWVAASARYVMQGSNNRISRFDAVTGEFLGWIGLIGASPTGGAAGCRGAAIDTFTPGWCFGGAAKGGQDSGAGGYRALSIDEANDWLFAISNKRLLKFELSTGRFLGWLGYVKFRTAADDGVCSVATYKTADDCTGNAGVWTPTAVPATVQHPLTFAVDDDAGHNYGSAHCQTKKPGQFTGGWCFGGHPETGNKNWAPGFNSPNGMVADAEYLYVVDAGQGRISKFRKANGRFVGWIGRISAVTDPDVADADVNALAKTSDAAHAGVSDCSKKCTVGTTITARTEAQCAGLGGTWTAARAAGDFTSAWCEGGTGTTNAANDGSISSPRGLGIQDDYLFVSDKAARIARYRASTGEYLGWVGKATAAPVGNAPGNPGAHCANYCRLTDHASKAACEAATGLWRVPANVCEHPTIVTNAASECTGSALGSSLAWSARSNMATNGWCLGGTTGSDSSADGDGMLNSNESLVAGPGFVYNGDDNDRIQRFELVTGKFRGWTGVVDAANQPKAGPDGHPDCGVTADGLPTPGWCYGGKAKLLDDSNHPAKGVFCSPEDQMGYANGRIFVPDGDCTRRGGRIHVFTVADASADGPNGSYYGWIGAMGTPTSTWESNATVSYRGIGANVGLKLGNGNGGGAVRAGYVYVVDEDHHRIVRFTQGGTYAGWLGRIATPPTSAADPCFGKAADAFSEAWCMDGTSKSGNGDGHMNKPTDLVIDAAGNLYVVDSSNHRILKFTAAGAFVGWKGRTSSIPACGGGAANATTPDWCTGGTPASGSGGGEFNTPIGIAASATSLFVAESGNNRVQKLALTNGAHQATFGTGAGAGDSQMSAPRSITWWLDPGTSTEYLFVSDRGNNRIVRYQVSTPASADGWIGYDAAATAAKSGFAAGGTPAAGAGDGAFNAPQGRGFVDADGVLFISDSGNHRLVKVNARTGAFLGWKGRVNATPTSGDSGCTARARGHYTSGWCLGGAAQAGSTTGFDGPRNLVFDGTAMDGDFVYLLEAGNHRVTRLAHDE